jgi:hypothetical protein
LIRSFRFSEEEITERRKLEVEFADYAIASLIFETALRQSLSYADDEDRQVQNALVVITARKKGAGVEASELAKELGISKDRAYAHLREALKRESILRANDPERGNKKLFLPAEQSRMLPDAGAVFQKLSQGRRAVRFVHPITGEDVEYRSNGKRS